MRFQVDNGVCLREADARGNLEFQEIVHCACDVGERVNRRRRCEPEEGQGRACGDANRGG